MKKARLKTLEIFGHFTGFQYFSIDKHKNIPSMDKDRQIVSELHDYFMESGCGLGIQRIMNILGTINQNKQLNAMMRVVQQLQLAA